MKVAMIVIDANEVGGEQWRKLGYSSPSVHPAIQSLIDALADYREIECFVLYGCSTIKAVQKREQGRVTYLGIPYRRLNIPGGAFIGRFFALRCYLKILKPDIVHGQGTEREAGLVAAYSGFPSILTLHGNFREIQKIFRGSFFSYYRVAAFLETIVLRKMNGLICISNYVTQITSSFKVKKFIIPNPVSFNFLDTKRTRSNSLTKRVCCMGTIDARKRTQFILEACILLWKKNLNFNLSIYGSPKPGDPYFEELLKEISHWKEHAVYKGFTSDPLQAITDSDIMVSASVEESFGMNVLEAMAVGTPVVASNVGGIVDLIVPGETGLLFESGNLEECASQIKQLLSDDALWQKLSDNGSRRAREFFNPSLIAEKTISAYKEVLNPSS